MEDNEDMENEKNNYLDKLKVVPVVKGSKDYPTFNLMIINKTDKKKIKVTSKFIFGDSIGSSLPFFVFNIELKTIATLFTKIFLKIPDEIMLENIKLLNKLLKGKPNLIEDLSKIKEFKSYLASFSFIKNKLYEVYKEFLKKLFFFSKSLFEAVFEEFRKYRMKNKNSKIDDIINGSNFDELQKIDDIIRGNINFINEILFKKIPGYDISEYNGDNVNSGNLYQITGGVLDLDKSSVDLYKIDYNADLDLLKEKVGKEKRGSTLAGNFYILMKCVQNDKTDFVANFNSYINCLVTKKESLSEKITCKNRVKWMGEFWEGFRLKRGGRSRKRKPRKRFTSKIKLN